MMRGICRWRANCVAALFVCLTASCSGPPSDDVVRADFLREHPDVTVEFVGVGEGDGSAAYFHIRYKKPGDDTLYEDIWQYLDAGEKQWRLNHKETLRKARRW
jgi:hypothetical protein